MKKKFFVVLIIVVFFNSFAAVKGYAKKKATLSLGAGISKISGDGNHIWKTGFNAGGNLFFEITPNFLFGGRFAYNRWALNEEKLINDFNLYLNDGTDITATGSASAIEIVPSVRIMSSAREGSKIRFFGQVGAGLYLVNMETTINSFWFNLIDYQTINVKDTRFGIDIGGGIILGGQSGNRFEIMPQYHIIFTEGEATRYFSVTLSALFNL